jgi:hypothetical protein
MVTILAFLVLGGGAAFAATKLAKNSVGTKQLKPVAAGTHNVQFNFDGLEEELIVDETELDVVFIPLAG